MIPSPPNSHNYGITLPDTKKPIYQLEEESGTALVFLKGALLRCAVHRHHVHRRPGVTSLGRFGRWPVRGQDVSVSYDVSNPVRMVAVRPSRSHSRCTSAPPCLTRLPPPAASPARACRRSRPFSLALHVGPALSHPSPTSCRVACPRLSSVPALFIRPCLTRVPHCIPANIPARSRRGFRVFTIPEVATPIFANSGGYDSRWKGTEAHIRLQAVFLRYDSSNTSYLAGAPAGHRA